MTAPFSLTLTTTNAYSKVKFYVDGTYEGAVSDAPYTFTYTSVMAVNGLTT